MSRFYRFLLHKNVFIYLVSIFTLALGIVATVTIMREAYPKVDFGSITISTVYPGASPEEVEQFVTNEIEKNIKNLDAIDEVESVSSEGRSYVALKLFAGEDQAAVLTDVEAAVNRCVFPEDVDEPVVTKIDSGAFPIVTVSLSGATGYADLRRYAKLLDDRLIQLNGVGRITRSHYLDQEYQVKVAPQLLRRMYVSIKGVVDAISKRSINMPGGKLETEKSEKIVRSVGEFARFEDVGQVVIRGNDAGNLVRIKDVATVEDTFADAEVIHRANGQMSIDLVLIKKESADIVTTIQEVRGAVAGFLSAYPDAGLSVTFTNDLSVEIDDRLSILYSNAIAGIAIVFIALFLFLNFKVALRVALGIPFSIFASMIFVNWIGITVNLVSLLGFILVIGMIVDNAIVVGENIYDKYEKGESPEEAVIQGTSEVVLPILFSTLTTIAAFSPLMMMGGIMGKFVWSIPVVVILAIVASLFYAMVILPNLMHDTLRGTTPKPRKQGGTLFDRLQMGYGRLVRRVIGVRYWVVLGFVVLLIGSVVLAGTRMNFVLFPNEDSKQFSIRFEGATDMNLEYLSREMAKVEQVVSKLPETELKDYLTSAGSINMDGFSSRRASNLGEIMVLLTPGSQRDRMARDIIEFLRSEVGALGLEGIKVTFEVAQNGPPVGKPVKIDILGHDYAELTVAASRVEEVLRQMEGVTDIENTYRKGKPEVRVRIDEAKTAIANLTMMDVAQEVKSAMGGTIATTLKRGDEEIDVRVIYSDAFRKSGSNVRALQIPNAQKQLVNIDSVASFSEEKGVSDITHFDRKRVVSVMADIDPMLTTSFKVNRDLEPLLKELNQEFSFLQFLQRGEDEDTQESLRNLFVAFIFALFLIFMIIASLFNGFAEPIVIMLAIPFGIIGVILAFLMHSAPISFMMLMGVIGLSGVVVNNTIILVSVIREFRASGLSPLESIVEGGKQRLRAVVLSSVTTLLGLFPTAYGIGGADEFIIPLCLALAWGLLFSTVLTLFLLPCTYAIFDDLKGRKLGVKR